MSQLDDILEQLYIAEAAIEKAINIAKDNPESDVRTDREPCELPELPLIGVGEIITDPTFGSRILKVTGPDTDSYSYRSSDNPIQRSWSADNTHFVVENTHGNQLLYHFYAVDMIAKFVKQLPFTGSDCSFHDLNQHLIFGRYGNKVIKVYNIETEAFDTVLDLDTLGLNLPEESYTGIITVMNNTLLTTCGGASQDYNHWVVIKHLYEDKVTSLNTLALTQFNKGQGFYLHGTQLDLSGRYVWMQPSNLSNDPGHLYVWDLETGEVEMVATCTSGHMCVGFHVWVNQDCAPGTPWDAAQWVVRDFATPENVTNIIDPVLQPKAVYLADHSSWTYMVDESDPFVSGMYRYMAEDVPWRAWDNEIITINPASGVVKRYAHHRSEVMKVDGTFDYWATPRPNVSCDGKWALFTSNWGRTLGTDSVEGGDRQDAFVVELR